MKAALALIILCLAGAARAEDKPSLLLYFGQQTTQDVQVGYPPYYSVWVDRIDAAKSAAHKHLAAYFNTIDECKGVDVGDVIVKVKPQLSYNPGLGIFFAQVRMEFSLGDGRHIGTLKATGQEFSYIDSKYVQEVVRKAYDVAMQNIAQQYASDTQLQESIRAGMATDFKRTPCGMVGLVPSQ